MTFICHAQGSKEHVQQEPESNKEGVLQHFGHTDTMNRKESTHLFKLTARRDKQNGQQTEQARNKTKRRKEENRSADAPDTRRKHGGKEEEENRKKGRTEGRNMMISKEEAQRQHTDLKLS